MDTNLKASLPVALQRDSTLIVPLAQGQSGAGVYRVDVAGATYVLKLTTPAEPFEAWSRAVVTQRAAAAAGVAPAVVHVHDDTRAVLSDYVDGESFMALYGNPDTRTSAIAAVANTMRRIHALPFDDEATTTDPQAYLCQLALSAQTGGTIPGFVEDNLATLLTSAPPEMLDALVLSHNDANPTNFVVAGERVLLLDWQTAAPNDRYYDLATIAVFLRMDAAACLAMLSAYDQIPVHSLPPRFIWCLRMAAALAGTSFLHLARQRGHANAINVAFANAPRLGDIYAQLRAGTLDMRSGAGQWEFGLALHRASCEF